MCIRPNVLYSFARRWAPQSGSIFLCRENWLKLSLENAGLLPALQCLLVNSGFSSKGICLISFRCLPKLGVKNYSYSQPNLDSGTAY